MLYAPNVGARRFARAREGTLQTFARRLSNLSPMQIFLAGVLALALFVGTVLYTPIGSAVSISASADRAHCVFYFSPECTDSWEWLRKYFSRAYRLAASEKDAARTFHILF